MSDELLVVLVVFIEMFLHYFPWRLVLRRDLPRLVAYMLGVLGMMGPFTAWLINHNDSQVATMLWLVLGAGGFAVASLYLLDWVIGQVWGKREAEQREQLLQEQRDGKSRPA